MERVRLPHRQSGDTYFELVAELIEAFAKSHDLGATLTDGLRRIVDVMNAEMGTLFQVEGDYDDPAAQLVCYASIGPVDMRGLQLPCRSGVVGRALRRDKPQLVTEPLQDRDFLPPPQLGYDYDVRSLIAAPACFRGRRIGAIELFNRRDGLPFTRRDAAMLATLASAAAAAIHNARLTEDLIEQTRLRQELELAAAVQRRLLPPTAPADAPIHGLSRPARGMSGDFYDILPLRDGRFAFALADVSGKGMDAALIMVKVATLFRSLARRGQRPGRLLAQIEAELCETLTMGMFVTMVVGIYDPHRHEVCMANAGHLPALLCEAGGGVRCLEAQAPPLGVLCRLQRNSYQESRFSVAGGALYLYTDGATEARYRDGTQVGIDGLRALIQRRAGLDADARLRSIASALDGEIAERRDDLTLLVIEDRPQQPLRQSAARGRRRHGAGLLVEQRVPAQARQLRTVRRLVLAAAESAGAPADWAQDFALAVDEACQNIIRHGYCGRSDGSIDLRLRRVGDRLRAELVDFAPRVDPRRLKRQAAAELHPGGLGTEFMRQLTDRVCWAKPPEGAGNRLLLSKRLPLPPKRKGRTAQRGEGL